MKKSQIEIIGLVIIVLIISVVFLFSLTFKVKSRIGQSGTFSNDQLATNFLLAILKTDHTLCDTSVETLIRDCAADKKIRCNDNNDACYHTQNFLNQVVPESLGINRLNSKYRLRIIKNLGAGTPEELFLLEDSCGPKQPKGMQGFQPISLYPKYPNGRVEVTLDICK